MVQTSSSASQCLHTMQCRTLVLENECASFRVLQSSGTDIARAFFRAFPFSMATPLAVSAVSAVPAFRRRSRLKSRRTTMDRILFGRQVTLKKDQVSRTMSIFEHFLFTARRRSLLGVASLVSAPSRRGPWRPVSIFRKKQKSADASASHENMDLRRRHSHSTRP